MGTCELYMLSWYYHDTLQIEHQWLSLEFEEKKNKIKNMKIITLERGDYIYMYNAKIGGISFYLF